jgi:hypothetical protein
MKLRPINEEQVLAFLTGLYGEDVHAMRILSLSHATLGVIHSASLSVHAIGHALAWARGRRTSTASSRWTGCCPTRASTCGASRPGGCLSCWGRARRPSSRWLWLTVRKSTLKGMRNETEDTVLMRLRELIPTHVQVTVLADRGFADVKLYALLEQLDFEYVVRFRQGIHVTSAEGERRTAAQMYYQAMPMMPDERLLPLVERFAQLVREQPFFSEAFGFI